MHNSEFKKTVVGTPTQRPAGLQSGDMIKISEADRQLQLCLNCDSHCLTEAEFEVNKGLNKT